MYAVNETLHEENNLRAVVQLYSLDSKKIVEQEVAFMIGSYDAKRLVDVKIEPGNTFLKLTLYNSSGKEIADNFYVLSDTEDTYQWEKSNWVGTPLASYSNFKALRQLPQGELSISPIRVDANKQVVFDIENRGERMVFLCEFLLKDKSGEVVFPVYWQDNYISLMPGEKKEMVCNFNPELLNTTLDYLQVKGWNIPEQTIPLY